MRTFRKGDLVTVVGVVEFDERPGERVLVKLEETFSTASFRAEALTLRRQKIWPGEQVKYDGECMTAIAVDGRDLWARKFNGETMILDVNEVVRVAPIENPRPAAAEAAE